MDLSRLPPPSGTSGARSLVIASFLRRRAPTLMAVQLSDLKPGGADDWGSRIGGVLGFLFWVGVVYLVVSVVVAIFG
jgi:hypothetical protein